MEHMSNPFVFQKVKHNLSILFALQLDGVYVSSAKLLLHVLHESFN